MWVNGFRLNGNCAKPMSKEIRIAFADLCLAMDADAATATRQTLSNVGSAKSRLKARAQTKLAKNEARQRFVNEIQEKVVTGLTLQSITVIENCIWVNGSPIDKLIPSSKN